MNKTPLWARLAIAAALVVTSTAEAQDGIHVGIFGGPNFAAVSFDPDAMFSTSARARAHVGGFVEIGLTPFLSLEGRGIYNQKGVDADDVHGRFNAQVTVDYLSFPVLLKVELGSAVWKPYFLVGPEIGFKTNAKTLLRSGTAEVDDPFFDDNIESTDFALDFGGGIDFPAERFSFLVEVVFSLGLTNIVVTPNADMASAKTRTLLIHFGIRF
jgi:hypothetical protein